MTNEEADRLVRAAIAHLAAEQRALLDINVSERALCHQLAVYIARELPEDRHVDVEYNRHGQVTKRLNLPRRQPQDDELVATTVFPDIIVHRRQSDEANDLVLEVKKPGESPDYDELKLRAFREQLGYRNCGHLILGLDGDGEIIVDLQWLAV